MGLDIELPMLLENNSGAVDVANIGVRGHTHCMDVCNCSLHKLKDEGMLMKHISGKTNDADISSKNVMSTAFNHNVSLHIGHVEYVRVPE